MKRKFEIVSVGNPQRAIFHPCSENGGHEELFHRLCQVGNDFAYVPVFVEDWNSQLSPWAAPAVFGKEDFAGQGAETLRWLTTECMPQVWRELGDLSEHLIGGYSLAGLFSLWAYYETGMFQGAASCSGSLWFPGWQEYAASHQGPDGSRVYLSLGDKEEHTRNQQMQKVGERTRWQHQLLTEDPNISQTTLEWNPGGHFQQPMERTLRGFAWLLGTK